MKRNEYATELTEEDVQKIIDGLPKKKKYLPVIVTAIGVCCLCGFTDNGAAGHLIAVYGFCFFVWLGVFLDRK